MLKTPTIQESGADAPKPQDLLLPCPFCGDGTPSLASEDFDDDCPPEWVVTCWECEFDIKGFSEAEAVEKWNRRSGVVPTSAARGDPIELRDRDPVTIQDQLPASRQ